MFSGMPAVAFRFIVLIWLVANAAIAAPRLDVSNLPGDLKGWHTWVLYGNEERLCSVRHDASGGNAKAQPGRTATVAAGDTQCRWAGVLDLRLNEHEATFSQTYTMQAGGWISVPGDKRHWPDLLSVNGRGIALIDRHGVPSIYLEAGEHRLQGRISWQTFPDSIQIPPATGLLRLGGSKGRDLVVDRDSNGRLRWAGQHSRASEAAIADSLQVRVFRRLTDDAPMRLDTLIQLDVTGADREMVLGPALPAFFAPVALKSQLPVRLEPDGLLRVQLRAGRWEVQLSGRLTQATEHFATAGVDPWPEQELWAFEAMPRLRSVTLSGASQVDVSQTLLPTQWREFPTYLVTTEQPLTITETLRGQGEPEANRLHLTRDIWPRPEGRLLIAKDTIEGQLNRDWRLDVESGVQLGNVSVQGQDQLITKHPATGASGVEVRVPHLGMNAVSSFHYERHGLFIDFPVTGWQNEFDSARIKLHLPPGWKAIAVDGADEAYGTWVQQWTIWDVFLVLFVVAALYKSLGAIWSLMGLIGLVLTYHEPSFSVWLWLNLCAVTGLSLVAKGERVRSWVATYRNLSVLLIAAALLQFSVQQVRAALHPQLDPLVLHSPVMDGQFMMNVFEPQAHYEAEYDAAPPVQEESGRSLSSMAMKSFEQANRLVPKAPSPGGKMVSKITPQPVQTGPGVPTWRWLSLDLSWQTAQPQQRVRVMLLSPGETSLLRLVAVLLLAILFGGFMLRFSRQLRNPRSLASTASLGLIGPLAIQMVLLAGTTVAPPAQAAIPDAAMLEVLEQRLLAPPDCLPECAGVHRADITLNGSGFRLEMEVSALADVWLPLPQLTGSDGLERVTLDGSGNPGTFRGSDGALYLRLAPGVGQVVLEYPVATRFEFELKLPMTLHNLKLRLDDWSVQGLVDGRVPGDALRFSRQQQQAERQVLRVNEGDFPAFTKIIRTLSLDLEWMVTTEVVRIAPQNSSINVQIPLLEGESVITPGIKVEKQKALIAIAPGQSSVQWVSRLAETSRLAMMAPVDAPWYEVWRVETGPLWQARGEGLPALRAEHRARHIQEWQPRPGESLVLEVARPLALEGQTVTIDSVATTYSIGKQRTDGAMTVQLRSSLGERFGFAVPRQVQVRTLTLNGQTMPYQEANAAVDVPLKVGHNRLELTWSETVDPGDFRWRSSAFAFNQAVNNLTYEVEPAGDRWLLYTSGPTLGPAVLYWGMLPVLVLLALFLGWHKGNSLNVFSWFMLGVGLSLTYLWGMLAAIVVFYVLEHRKNTPPRGGKWKFRFTQTGLLLLSIICFATVLAGIPAGLLGEPEMHVQGNNSSAHLLKWYLDWSAGDVPQVQVGSVSLWAYRALMLLWSLWLALAFVRWLVWAWGALCQGGFWTPETGGSSPPAGSGPASDAGQQARGSLPEGSGVPAPHIDPGTQEQRSHDSVATLDEARPDGEQVNASASSESEKVPLMTHEQDLMAQSYTRAHSMTDSALRPGEATADFELKLDLPLADHEISRYLVDENNLPDASVRKADNTDTPEK